MRNKSAFSTIEVLVSTVIVTLIFASTIGAFMLVKGVFRDKEAEINLQQNVNTIAARIIRGHPEQGSIVGLRSAVSFTIPVVTPAGSRIQYTGTDDNVRSYFLNGNSIIYASPTQSPNQQTIYTAPPGSSVTLRFWEPAGVTDNETVGIYIAVSRQIGNRTISGSLSTYINLRNVPK
ncbi:MAG: type II secretion system protein [Candidatus Omnitrophota bacterium]